MVAEKASQDASRAQEEITPAFTLYVGGSKRHGQGSAYYVAELASLTAQSCLETGIDRLNFTVGGKFKTELPMFYYKIEPGTVKRLKEKKATWEKYCSYGWTPKMW